MPRPIGFRPKTSPRYLEKLEDVKATIRGYWEEQHAPPSMNELARHYDASVSNVSAWITKLERDGWLEPSGKGADRKIIPSEIFKDRPVFPGA